MTSADPELVRLLVQELQRHLATLKTVPIDVPLAKRSLHALRGSAGLSGERELAAALERLHRRIREGDEAGLGEAAAIVATAVDRLSQGLPALPANWPVPPEDLVPLPIDPLVRGQYAAEVTDRLGRIDDALATSGDPVLAVRAIYRHIHTVKGAASAVSDEPMSWFCHGLEEKIRGAELAPAAREAMQEVAHWRAILGALLEEPEATLATLRARGSHPSLLPPSSRLSSPPSSSPDASARPPHIDGDAATIRVRAGDVDRLIERLDVIDRARERIAGRTLRGRDTASKLRELRGSLAQALRLIGPARPWGAPAGALAEIERVAATLGGFGDEMDGASVALSAAEQSLRENVIDAKKELATMRQSSVGRIFARLTTAIESEARRGASTVIVQTRGADETIDRRIADQLMEPCLQLVRNAVAHGIEAPEVRTALGKPASGTIALSARKIGHRLRITIADDGAGVDVAHVRRRAVETGLVTAAIAEAADDDTLLSLLFLPGFSTRQSSDLLAGRGIGLDITRAWIKRMGGAIRLSSRAGEGFTARLDVPIESGLATVLWVRAGDDEFALTAQSTRRVEKNYSPGELRAPHLLACLGATAPSEAPYVVDLGPPSDDVPEPPAWVGVDAIGRTEELLVRPLGALVAGFGPYSGAIVRGDGSVRLAIDAWAIAPRARAMAAALPGSRR
jgi:chemotaxis protein histidine kinase CheA